MKTIDWIFWDNDGVLVDTEHLYLEATRKAIEQTGFTLTDEIYREYFLRQNLGIWHLLDPLRFDEAHIAALKNARNRFYSELLATGDLVLPGAIETLQSLHGKFKMGIVTSSYPDHFDIVHQSSGILQYLEFAITPNDYKNSKPDPEPYLLAIERAAVTPDRCLVIEDSERGLRAARAAGLRCWILPSRLTTGLQFEGAERVLQSISQIPALLREQH